MPITEPHSLRAIVELTHPINSEDKTNCPFHDDAHPSCHIYEDRYKCFACDEHGNAIDWVKQVHSLDVGEAIGFLRERGFTFDKNPELETYDYTDASGNLLFQVVRSEPKRFWQRQPKQGGQWQNSLQGVTPVLYRLPRVLEAVASGEPIYLVEGEKDVHTLEVWGKVATCNPMGAGKWRDNYSEMLKGAYVVILPDNDEAGINHARSVALSLGDYVASLAIVRLPDLPPKGDVSDWAAQGSGETDLQSSVSSTQAWAHGESTKLLDFLNAALPSIEEEPDPSLHSLTTNSVEPFPVEVLPDPLANLTMAAAAALPCPPDFIAVPMLGILGAAIGTTRVLEVQPGWREGARIYAGVAADAGSKKSPALAIASKPLKEWQSRAGTIYKEAKEAFFVDAARYELDYAAWKKDPSSDPPAKPDEPSLMQCYTTDATQEAIAQLLQNNPRGLIFLQDELTAWVRSMDQYKAGKGSDKQTWLSFWSGSAVIVNRKGSKEPITLPNPHVCVVGCLPPDVLGELLDEKNRDDGFIHRILLSYPESVKLTWNKAVVGCEFETAYHKVFEALWQLESAYNERGEPVPVVLKFTSRGEATFDKYMSEHCDEVNAASFPEHLRGPWAKLQGYAARLALILHLARWAAGEVPYQEVDEVSVSGAAALVNYFKSHASKVYAHLSASTEDKRLHKLHHWLLRQPEHRASLRDITRSGVAGIKTKQDALDLLNKLVQQGAGKFVTITYLSGQSGEGFELNN